MLAGHRGFKQLKKYGRAKTSYFARVQKKRI
jgi:hypothetical protein